MRPQKVIWHNLYKLLQNNIQKRLGQSLKVDKTPSLIEIRNFIYWSTLMQMDFKHMYGAKLNPNS